ncbi:endopeptidase [Mycobacterium sp. 852002-10029_SCH5224772]|uniref:endopeptidase n=1 Tax=Mycobacterium sp. 852002-10029_SCH5224772 TaxID=1834083 RepID=UPI0007FC6E31|nr:endopeptidase [Mycobacterium sp. 852002-10029_SCH5224772]OBF03808.1 endopeptidase [Mycobacterium sp. 852002-10029_SCH5224772]
MYALEFASWGSTYSPARTVALPLSALVLAVLAVLGFLPSRSQRRRRPKTRAFADLLPQRAKLHTALLTVAAVCSTAALVAAICLFPRAATSAQQPPPPPPPSLAPIDLPAATAIGPGAGIYVDYADGSGGMGCTAGFLVHTSGGQTGVFTAGHCNRPGGPSRVTMNLGGVLPYTTLGTFTQTISEGVHDEQHDIGLITLDGDNVPQSSAIAASLPVAGIATNLQVGQQLCKFGMGSGADACGQIVEITGSKVVFLASGQCGDSGGPVYRYERGGTVSAVGILIRGGDPYTPKAGCAARAKFSVAELVRPWLEQWRLTAITAPASPG